MTMPTVYIAGPMTGLPEFNYPAFFEAAERLERVGYQVLNPARTEGREDCRTWQEFMRASLRDIADADGIATLDGWANSTGASLEVQIGRGLQLDVRTVDEWLARWLA